MSQHEGNGNYVIPVSQTLLWRAYYTVKNSELVATSVAPSYRVLEALETLGSSMSSWEVSVYREIVLITDHSLYLISMNYKHSHMFCDFPSSFTTVLGDSIQKRKKVHDASWNYAVESIVASVFIIYQHCTIMRKRLFSSSRCGSGSGSGRRWGGRRDWSATFWFRIVTMARGSFANQRGGGGTKHPTLFPPPDYFVANVWCGSLAHFNESFQFARVLRHISYTSDGHPSQQRVHQSKCKSHPSSGQ